MSCIHSVTEQSTFKKILSLPQSLLLDKFQIVALECLKNKVDCKIGINFERPN